MAGLAECELGLGFEATGTLGGRGLGAYMSVHNNGPLDPVDQWLVAWTLPNDRLEAGTVDGVILVSAGVNGAPLRVVNTDSNAQIPVGGSKSFSFRMDSLQSSSEGLSRAPSDLSVNGKVCRPADGRASADLCVAPAVLPTLSNASSSSGGGGESAGCSVEYCCGKRLEADPSSVPAEEPPFLVSTWGLCDTRASISQFQLRVENSSIPLLLVTVQPSGGFSLCDVQDSLPANTALEVILSSDTPLDALSMGLVDLSNLTSDTLSPEQLSTPTSPCKTFEPQALPNIQEQYWPHPWRCVEISTTGGRGANAFVLQNTGATPINMVLGSIATRGAGDPAAIGGSASLLRATSESFGEAPETSWVQEGVNYLFIVFPLVALVVGAVGLAVLARRKVWPWAHPPAPTRKEDVHVLLFRQGTVLRSPSRSHLGGARDSYEGERPLDGDIPVIDFDNEIVLERVLGSGSFGAVHQGRLNGKNVAVKMMHSVTSEKDLESVRMEVAAMAGLKHPRVVRLLACCLEPPNVCLVQELAENGSLHSALHPPGMGANRRLDYLTLLRIAIDIADGMSYLHPSLVHRDLKTQNILLDRSCRAQVCDFGIAKFKERTFLTTLKAQAGTPAYMAPEMFEGSSEISEKCDVYSFAVILWEMITGEVPWDGATPMQVIFAVGVQRQRLPLPPSCPEAMQGLVERCWAADPGVRPGFPEILQSLLVERRRALAVAGVQPRP